MLVHVSLRQLNLKSVAGCSGEMFMSDESVMPCAIKTVKYATDQQRERAHLELAALKAALAAPNLVQCLGAFRSTGPDGPVLHIATE